MLTLVMSLLPPNVISEETNTIPGYFEVSEYLTGSVGAIVITLESNGTIDEQTQNWTTTEDQEIIFQAENVSDWLAAQEPRANITFVLQYYLRLPTPYEPIDRPTTDIGLWIGNAMDYLGYLALGRVAIFQVWDFINDIRDDLGTDWIFVIFVVDSSDDPDGQFLDGGEAFNDPGGPMIFMTSTVGPHGAENFGRVLASEIAGLFWAVDEDRDTVKYSGYLNASNCPHSGCLMDNLTWCLSNGTRRQLGWADDNEDGKLDIVGDVELSISIDSSTIIGDTLNLSGVVHITPVTNKNSRSNNLPTIRDVTINKIQHIMYQVDDGNWSDAEITPQTVTVIQKWNYSNTVYKEKTTWATVNYTIATSLETGNHTITIKAIDDWDNSAQINTTATAPGFLRTDLNKDGIVNIMDIAIVAQAYGAKYNETDGMYWHDPPCGHCPHTSDADLDDNKEINILDVAKVAKDYGKTV